MIQLQALPAALALTCEHLGSHGKLARFGLFSHVLQEVVIGLAWTRHHASDLVVGLTRNGRQTRCQRLHTKRNSSVDDILRVRQGKKHQLARWVWYGMDDGVDLNGHIVRQCPQLLRSTAELCSVHTYYVVVFRTTVSKGQDEEQGVPITEYRL